MLEHGVCDAGSWATAGSCRSRGITSRSTPTGPAGAGSLGDDPRAGGGAIAPTDTVSVAFAAYRGLPWRGRLQVPEAAAACAQADSAPRAVDLLIRYVADSLKGRLEPRVRPGGSGRRASTNPG